MKASRIDDAAFLGQLTAGATHEIRNVLSVIKESAGLMEDLLHMVEDQSFPYTDKFKKMVTNILGQVQRGTEIMKGLNTLAHATDERMRTVDVNQVLECQAVLYDRFCRLKGVPLTARPSEGKAHVLTDPLILHYSVCALIQVLLERAPEKSEITLTCEPVGELLHVDAILFRSETLLADDTVSEEGDQSLSVARQAAEALGGSLELGSNCGRCRLTIPVLQNRNHNSDSI